MFLAVTVRISLFVHKVLPCGEVHFSMTFLFVHFLGDVVFVFNVLSGLIHAVVDEGLDLLRFTEANTLV